MVALSTGSAARLSTGSAGTAGKVATGTESATTTAENAAGGREVVSMRSMNASTCAAIPTFDNRSIGGKCSLERRTIRLLAHVKGDGLAAEALPGVGAGLRVSVAYPEPATSAPEPVQDNGRSNERQAVRLSCSPPSGRSPNPMLTTGLAVLLSAAGVAGSIAGAISWRVPNLAAMHLSGLGLVLSGRAWSAPDGRAWRMHRGRHERGAYDWRPL